MAAITLKLGGRERLQDNLRRLDDAMQKRVLANSMRSTMNLVLRPAVIAASPARTGKVRAADRRKTKLESKTLGPLKRSWSVVKVRGRPGQVRFVLKSNTRTRDAFYAIFLEQGWLAGRRILKREIRRSLNGGAPLRPRRAVPARPFVRPAAEAAFQTMVSALTTATEAQVELVTREFR
jgi:hypothetical protein